MDEPRLIRTTGALFVVGSALFALGVLLSLPGVTAAVYLSPLVSGVTYVVGAVFFTTAAACQLLLARRDLPASPHRWLPLRERTSDWLAAAVQLVGTVLFNVDTVDAVLTLHAHPELQDEVVWTPDAVGSIAFLVSSVIALAPEVRARRQHHRLDRTWWIAALNLAGSILFGISAVAAYVLRDGDLVSLAWTNVGTFLGALCFLVAAWMFGFPRRARAGAGARAA